MIIIIIKITIDVWSSYDGEDWPVGGSLKISPPISRSFHFPFPPAQFNFLPIHFPPIPVPLPLLINLQVYPSNSTSLPSHDSILFLSRFLPTINPLADPCLPFRSPSNSPPLLHHSPPNTQPFHCFSHYLPSPRPLPSIFPPTCQFASPPLLFFRVILTFL